MSLAGNHINWNMIPSNISEITTRPQSNLFIADTSFSVSDTIILTKLVGI